jgi:hypothetical protein
LLPWVSASVRRCDSLGRDFSSLSAHILRRGLPWFPCPVLLFCFKDIRGFRCKHRGQDSPEVALAGDCSP